MNYTPLVVMAQDQIRRAFEQASPHTAIGPMTLSDSILGETDYLIGVTWQALADGCPGESPADSDFTCLSDSSLLYYLPALLICALKVSEWMSDLPNRADEFLTDEKSRPLLEQLSRDQLAAVQGYLAARIVLLAAAAVHMSKDETHRDLATNDLEMLTKGFCVCQEIIG